MQGLKPVIFRSFTARLKSCPDTKHECFHSRYSRALIQDSLSAFCKALDHLSTAAYWMQSAETRKRSVPFLLLCRLQTFVVSRIVQVQQDPCIFNFYVHYSVQMIGEDGAGADVSFEGHDFGKD
jgi:hypothetical protein